MIEIYRSLRKGVIVTPTSGGLYNSRTPTNDFIDNQVQEYNPFVDINID
jgi:hypothetical protein